MFREQRFGHKIKSEGNPNDKKQAEKTGKKQSDEIQTAVFVAYGVAQNPPPEPCDESNLFAQPGVSTYVSHESSSI
jgi:hypothetical protein